MKKNTIKLAMLAGVTALTMVSCKKEGCTDATAVNFDSDAKKNDNSCVYDNADNTPVYPEKYVSDNISSSTTWSKDTVYVIAGRIVVENNSTLTIEPGTVIKGLSGIEANAKALVIARGSKIMAQGTAAEPIIFTSNADRITPADVAAGNIASPNLQSTTSGLWGGLIVLGNAPISDKNDLGETNIEGIPATDPNGLYGGSNASDNSGVLTYVSIRHGGTDIGEGNEINGLTLGGVGSGTTINHIEVLGNQDDGIEFFGGTVNVNDAVIWNNGDDGLDTDQDWTGTVNNFYVIAPTGHAFELDGPEGTAFSGDNFKFINGTVIASDASQQVERLVDIDPNTNGTLENVGFVSVVAGQVVEGNTIGTDVSPVIYKNLQLDVADVTAHIKDGTTITSGSTVTAGTYMPADKSAFSGWSWAYTAM